MNINQVEKHTNNSDDQHQTVAGDLICAPATPA